MRLFLKVVTGPLRRGARFLSRYSRRSSLADVCLARASARLVGGYRRFLSPYKGFRCAAVGAGGGESCSSVAVMALTSLPFSRAVDMIEVQIGHCQRAFQTLKLDVFGQALEHLSALGDQADVALLACNGEPDCCCCPEQPIPKDP